jgi:hypothetical protein
MCPLLTKAFHRATYLVIVSAFAATDPGPPNGQGGVPKGLEESKTRAEVLAKMVQDVVAAKDKRQAQQRYRALFDRCGAAGLPALRLSPRTGVALQAAYEEVLLTTDGGQKVRASKPNLVWFLGFLEGRARVEAPQWWKHALAHSERTSEGHRGPYNGQPYYKALPGADRALPAVTLQRRGGRLLLLVGEQSASVPEGFFEATAGSLKHGEERKALANVGALIAGERCYTTRIDPFGLSSTLVCSDRESGKVRWKAKVWATRGRAFAAMSWLGPLPDAAVMITERDERVVVFGACGSGFYVEVFRAADGTNLFRFATVRPK